MKISEGPGRFAATAGVMAVVTAGFGWLEVLCGWAIAAFVRILPKGEERKLPKLWGMALIAATAMAAECAFPKDNTFPFVSAGLIALLYRTLICGQGNGKQAANVLGLILLGMLGIILVPGLGEVQWKETIPQEISVRKIWVSAAMTGAWWSKKEDDRKWFLRCVAVTTGLSLVTCGVLGYGLTQCSPCPLYSAVESLRFFGHPQHLEGLLAMGGVFGAYGMMAIIGEKVRGAEDRTKKQMRVQVGCAGIGGFLLEMAYRTMPLNVKERILTVFWGVLPFMTLWLVNLRKTKNVCAKMM